jgi:hypothetical protein
VSKSNKAKRGRKKKAEKVARAKAQAAARAAAHRADKACHFCGETDRHMARFRAQLEGYSADRKSKQKLDWKLCRSCAAMTLVLLRDPRNKRR